MITWAMKKIFGTSHERAVRRMKPKVEAINKLEKDMKEGKVPKPIEDLPSEWAKEDREIEGAKPDLAEAEEDPSEL